MIERALPFPAGPGWDFHDHWLALVALSLGDVAYVDRPLYDYVQHPGAVLGPGRPSRSRPTPGGTARGPGSSAGAAPGPLARRLLQPRTCSAIFRRSVLLARCAEELTPRKRRALRR